MEKTKQQQIAIFKELLKNVKSDFKKDSAQLEREIRKIKNLKEYIKMQKICIKTYQKKIEKLTEE